MKRTLLIAATIVLGFLVYANARMLHLAAASQPACVKAERAAYGAAQPSC